MQKANKSPVYFVRLSLLFADSTGPAHPAILPARRPFTQTGPFSKRQ